MRTRDLSIANYTLTTNDERRTTNNQQPTTNEERRTKNQEPRTTNDEPRTNNQAPPRTMRHANIQILFREITLENVRVYLGARGWVQVEDPRPDVLRFAGPASSDADRPQIWLWQPDDHPKFRSRIPNLIFTLAVAEQREALDVANDVRASSAKKAATADGDAGGPRGCTIARRCATPLEIRIGASGIQFALKEGESLQVLATGPSGQVPRLELGESVAVVEAGPEDMFECYFGLAPVARLDVRATLLEQLAPFASIMDVSVLVDELSPLLDRISFELDELPVVPTPATRSEAAGVVRRQAAQLLVALSQRLAASSGSHSVLWNLGLHLVSLAGLRLRCDPGIDADLYATTSTDRLDAPKSTLEWLKTHARG